MGLKPKRPQAVRVTNDEKQEVISSFYSFRHVLETRVEKKIFGEILMHSRFVICNNRGFSRFASTKNSSIIEGSGIKINDETFHMENISYGKYFEKEIFRKGNISKSALWKLVKLV